MNMIIASAIKFKIEGSDYPQIMCGKRHSDIFNLMYDLGIKYQKPEEQGFLTSYNGFVDREQGAILAYISGQIKEPKKELFSEDLW